MSNRRVRGHTWSQSTWRGSVFAPVFHVGCFSAQHVSELCPERLHNVLFPLLSLLCSQPASAAVRLPSVFCVPLCEQQTKRRRWLPSIRDNGGHVILGMSSKAWESYDVASQNQNAEVTWSWNWYQSITSDSVSETSRAELDPDFTRWPPMTPSSPSYRVSSRFTFILSGKRFLY